MTGSTRKSGALGPGKGNVYVCVDVYVYVSVSVCVYVCVGIYIYIYVYMYIYIYICIRICICVYIFMSFHEILSQATLVWRLGASERLVDPSLLRPAQASREKSGVHKGGFNKGGFSKLCDHIMFVLLNPPLRIHEKSERPQDCTPKRGLEYGRGTYGLRCSAEICGSKWERTIFHEYLQEYCFVIEISENIRKPPRVYGRR